MKVDVSARSLVEAPEDALVLECYAGEERTGPEMRRVDVALGGLLTLALRDQRFEGRVAEIADVHTGGRLPAKRVLVVGLGPRAECTAETLRRAAAAAVRRARDLGVGERRASGAGDPGPGPERDGPGPGDRRGRATRALPLRSVQGEAERRSRRVSAVDRPRRRPRGTALRRARASAGPSSPPRRPAWLGT